MIDACLKPATILVMAGGTGGHVFPALAVAQVLRDAGWRVEWLGTAQGIEERVVPANGILLHRISAVGLRGKHWRKLLVAPWHLLRACMQTMAVFRRVRPSVVLGMGGFASAPGGLCAWVLRVPLVIHEQNAVAGTANRLLSRLASTVLTAFPDVLPAATCVGNPVRQVIADLAQLPRTLPAPERRLRLLVLGGSQGARALNTLVPSALALIADNLRPEVFHQAGPALLEETRQAYLAAGVSAEVEPFIEDMASRYAWADLAICRAGAMTVSELACAQLPAVLVPFPFAIDDHQTHNGLWLVKAGAARQYDQSGLTPEVLADQLRQLLEHRNDLHAMSQALRSLARPDAAQVVAKACGAACHGE